MSSSIGEIEFLYRRNLFLVVMGDFNWEYHTYSCDEQVLEILEVCRRQLLLTGTQ